MFLEEWPKVTVWSRHYKPDAEGEGSTAALLEYDCERLGHAEYVRYDFPQGGMLGEPEGAAQDETLQWRYPPPGPGMSYMVRKVCDVARAQRDAGDPLAEAAKAGKL